MGSLKKQKRGRLQTACSRCRERKIKCDKHRPCQNCSKKGEECVDSFRGQEECEHELVHIEADVMTDQESYWREQLYLIKESSGPIYSPFCNFTISKYLIHVIKALIESNPGGKPKEYNKMPSLMCIESFKFQVSLIIPSFKYQFNSSLGALLFTLLIEQDIFHNINEKNPFGKLYFALTISDIITLIEYAVTFIVGSCQLGWQDLEAAIYSNYITLLSRLFLLGSNSRDTSERLLYTFMFMAIYFDYSKLKLGSAASCYFQCSDLVKKWGIETFNADHISRVWFGLLWSSKTKSERNYWTNICKKLSTSPMEICSFCLCYIASGLRLQPEHIDLPKLEQMMAHAENAFNFIGTAQPQFNATSEHLSIIILETFRAEILVRQNKMPQAYAAMEKIQHILESFSDIVLWIALQKLQNILTSFREISQQYVKDDGSYTCAVDEILKGIEYIPTIPRISPEDANGWNEESIISFFNV